MSTCISIPRTHATPPHVLSRQYHTMAPEMITIMKQCCGYYVYRELWEEAIRENRSGLISNGHIFIARASNGNVNTKKYYHVVQCCKVQGARETHSHTLQIRLPPHVIMFAVTYITLSHKTSNMIVQDIKHDRTMK